jgi:hypothetical protein
LEVNIRKIKQGGGKEGDPLGRPARMIEGDSAELHTPDSVIVGKAQSERLGSPKVGDVFEINDRLARVVGIADAPRDFQGNPFIFTTYDRALQYTPLQRKQLNIVLMGDLHRQDGIFGMDRSISFKVMICPWNNKRGN